MDNLKKKKTIHELAKANPNKSYREIEEMQEAINQLQNEAEKGNVIDNDLINKFDQLFI